MGLLNLLFGKSTSTFEPNFSETEFDNWLDYLDKGGTTREWEILKKENNWSFAEDETEKHFAYEKELRPVFNKYNKLLDLIQHQWPDLYKSKDYNSKLAAKIEKECDEAVSYFKEIQKIDSKYNQPVMNGSPIFTKLALLYERRGDYEKSIKVCKMAIEIGMDESKRMEKLIRKAGREPTSEEFSLLESLRSY